MATKCSRAWPLIIALAAAAGAAFAQQGATYSILSFAKGDTAYAYSDKINVRESASTDSKVLVQMMTGDPASVLEETATRQTIYGIADYWYKVDVQGQQGYVWGGLLAKDAGIAEIEGKGSADRIVVQAVKSYQDSAPTYLNTDELKNSILPKLSPEGRDFVQRYYRPLVGGEPSQVYLCRLDDSGNPIDEPDVTISKAEILRAEKALAGISLPDIYPQEFGLSGKILVKALSGRKALWELSYPFPRLSAPSTAENLLGMEMLGTPENPDERFAEDFGEPEVTVLAGKGLSPSVVLLSISIPADFDEGTWHQAALYMVDAKGATLVTTYCAGNKAGGEGARTELVFPADQGGEKNQLIFKNDEMGDISIIGKLRWNGALFTRAP